MSVTRFGFLILAFIGAFATSGCFDKPSDDASDEDGEESSYRAEKAGRDEIRKRVNELRAEKKELESSLKEFSKTTGKKDEVVREEIAAMAKLEEARGYHSSLEAFSKELDLSLEQWRTATRSSFKGVQLPEITTVSGTRFESATILGVDDSSLSISHSGGEATIPVLELPLTLRRNLIHETTVLSER